METREEKQSHEKLWRFVCDMATSKDRYRLALALMLDQIDSKLDHLLTEVRNMAVDQATFDTELAGLVQAITDLNSAVDALIASKGGVDLTAEESSVQAASAAIAAELAKVNPAPPAAPAAPPAP